MKILMFGWEFPPKISGGLGVACHGIVQSLLTHSCEMTLVLPFLKETTSLPEARLHYLSTLRAHQSKLRLELIATLLRPYKNTVQYQQLYGHDLLSEVKRYAEEASRIAGEARYNVIHAHDWLTVLAGLHAKKISGKPLVFHVHAIEKDRSPNGQDVRVRAVEEQGLKEADVVIAVSQYTKQRIMEEYSIPGEKIHVIHNGYSAWNDPIFDEAGLVREPFMVLFLGRITEQKGVHYFIKAAEKILSHRRDVGFIIAGDGDQLSYAIEACASAGIASHVYFTGFLERGQVKKMYQASDVYVMPSVSEPFGLTCLEAIAQNIPVVLSKQAGVAEVITHALKVDFWDTDQLAEEIIALLEYPALQAEMLPHAKRQLAELTWDAAAKKILHIYHCWTS